VAEDTAQLENGGIPVNCEWKLATSIGLGKEALFALNVGGGRVIFKAGLG